MVIHLTGRLTEDRRLIVDIPADIPPGEVQITLEVTDVPLAANEATLRARAKLLAAGALSTIWKAPPGTIPPTEEELAEWGALPDGTPSLDELVNEERAER